MPETPVSSVEIATIDAIDAEQPAIPSEYPDLYPRPVKVALSSDFRRYLMLIGLGLFVTSFAQPGVIARLPLQNMLKTEAGLSPQQMASFFAIAAFAWYLKPVVGLVIDSAPLFGTRRRYYLLSSAAAATALWFLLRFVPHKYAPLLAMIVAINAMMVIASTVIGGLFVEEGQKSGATGRLSSFRQGLSNTTGLIVGPIGGYLATRAFGWTTGIATGLFLLLTTAAFFQAKETTPAPRNPQFWQEVWQQIKTLLHSKTLWAAAGMQFLLFVTPGFNTPLYYHQINVLHFTNQFIGNLGVISGIVGIGGALLYGFLCKRFSLRSLLVIGIAVNAFGTLGYLFYTSHGAAIGVEALGGLIGSLAAIPLFDLAARATPKGSESLGYALLMSVGNIAAAISDVVGSWLYDTHHWPFVHLVWLNAGTTALVLLAVPFLPRVLMQQRDGETVQGNTA